MRTTLPGSVGFAYLLDRVIDSYLKDMTSSIDSDRQIRPPCPLRSPETAALCVVFLKSRHETMPFDDNSLIGYEIYPPCCVLPATR
jgi:hypothetical protein